MKDNFLPALITPQSSPTNKWVLPTLVSRERWENKLVTPAPCWKTSANYTPVFNQAILNHIHQAGLHWPSFNRANTVYPSVTSGFNQQHLKILTNSIQVKTWRKIKKRKSISCWWICKLGSDQYNHWLKPDIFSDISKGTWLQLFQRKTRLQINWGKAKHSITC